MGLDQYALAVIDVLPEGYKEVHDGIYEPEDDEEGYLSMVYVDEEFPGKFLQRIATWRKHPSLQGWMESQWQKSTGSDDDFNCIKFPLTVELIDQLETDVREAALPHTEGFFFGDDSSDYYREKDLAFCAKARELMSSGTPVLYDSWW